MSLRQRAVRAVTWSAVSAGGAQLAGVLIFVALARLLPPEAFGLVAWAGVFMGFLQIFVTAGLSQSLVQREHLEDGHLDAALYASLALTAAIGAIVVLGAGPLATFLDEPALAPVLGWLALVLPLNALAAVPQAILRRELRFKPLAMRVLTANTIGGIAGIAMALLGFGIWALVGQQVVTAATAAVVLWTSITWRPGLRGSWLRRESTVTRGPTSETITYSASLKVSRQFPRQVSKSACVTSSNR